MTNALSGIFGMKTYVIILSFLMLFSCSLSNKLSIKKGIPRQIKKSSVFSEYFVGLHVYDPLSKETIISLNGDKYFTPASNTKILTLASYLSLGLDSIPTFYINEKGELSALGDPTLLHLDFVQQPAFERISQINTSSLKIYTPEHTERYGPGWAWDDYHYNFQPERSTLPVYGNVLSVKSTWQSLEVIPDFFESFIDTASIDRSRVQDYNLFSIPWSKLEDTTRYEIPFIIDREITEILLEDTLYKDVFLVPGSFNSNQIIYNQPVIPVLALMMQRSDNFLAEQLLINAQLFSGYESLESYIDYLKNNVFNYSPDELIWVDGSGLSRYNMLTPRSLVSILESIYNQLDWEDIDYIFPTGGKSGTIKNWYPSEKPYVEAKTGTLRHNHNLSGYLLTKTGKVLIFSFMNNHYPFSSSVVKKEMEKILIQIRDKY